MIEALPVRDVIDECEVARINQATIIATAAMVGATVIALVYDGETLLPVVGALCTVFGLAAKSIYDRKVKKE